MPAMQPARPDPQKPDLRIEDILSAVCEPNGIRFKTIRLLRIKVIDDHVVPTPIDTIEVFSEGFEDGEYQFFITDAIIDNVGIAPVEIPFIIVTVTLKEGIWLEPRIWNDDESIYPGEESPATLEERLYKIVARFKPALIMLNWFIRLAWSIRHLFGA